MLKNKGNTYLVNHDTVYTEVTRDLIDHDWFSKCSTKVIHQF